jgi:hypothetical protein
MNICNVIFPSPTFQLKKGDLAVEVCYNATQFGSSSNAETLIFARRIDDSVISNNNNNNNKTNNNKIS